VATKRNPWSFTPYKPPPVPTGSYDPALDAQYGASQRGLADLGFDAERNRLRLTSDYGVNTQQIQQQSAWGQEDLMRGSNRGAFDLTQQRDRGMQDLGTARTRGDEDYQRSLAALTRDYDRLGIRQTEQQAQAGALRSGAALQAARKRAENQAWDRQPIDTSYNRFTADNAQAQQRLGQDYGTAEQRRLEDLFIGTSRGNQQRDTALGQAALGYSRGNEDIGTGLLRGTREAQEFGLDIEAQKRFQAAQMNYVPPQRGEPGGIKANEFTKPDGTAYRVIIRGNERIEVDRTGKVLSRRRR
jgi:hypothetical protein